MALIQRLNVEGLRNLRSLICEPAEKTTIIWGENGAGKTAILEAVYLLATGRSFREHRLAVCQQWQSNQMMVFAQVVSASGEHRLGWQRQSQETHLRVDGQAVSSQAAIAPYLPVQVFAPDYQDAWVQGPAERRKFMDWGAFYTAPDFMSAWRHYQQALRQRNQALKLKLSDQEIALWHQPLWQSAMRLDAIRRAYVQRLLPIIADYAPRVSDALQGLGLHYHTGWAQDGDLLVHWETHIEQDRLMGFTQAGPHRADLKFKVDGKDALSVLSRGQQKLLAFLLLLVQTLDLTQHTAETPILLLDDLSAELDTVHRERVLALLPELNCQCFLTTTNARQFDQVSDAVYWQMSQGVLVS